MSLLGTINPNISPDRAVESYGDRIVDHNRPEPSRAQGHNRTESLGTDDTAFEEVGDEEKVAERVTDLARRLTRQSTRYSISTNAENPFLGTKEDSSLNPSSPNFNAKNWMKNLLAITSRDPERYPQRTAGVSFKNLSVHGFGSPTDYQKDVFNAVLEIGTLFRYLMGTGKQKIQILREFDGLVKSGEMLVVLGRPGRYVKPACPS